MFQRALKTKKWYKIIKDRKVLVYYLIKYCELHFEETSINKCEPEEAMLYNKPSEEFPSYNSRTELSVYLSFSRLSFLSPISSNRWALRAHLASMICASMKWLSSSWTQSRLIFISICLERTANRTICYSFLGTQLMGRRPKKSEEYQIYKLRRPLWVLKPHQVSGAWGTSFFSVFH